MSISGRRISGFNPMAAVDIDAIEAQMKMAALDTLKGYSAEHYGIVKQYRETDYIAERNAGGYQVLREPAWNKGTYTRLFLCSRAKLPDSALKNSERQKSKKWS
jgi:malate dehydrogenase (oxaloacetate-decarboxylating)(NADP+)